MRRCVWVPVVILLSLTACAPAVSPESTSPTDTAADEAAALSSTGTAEALTAEGQSADTSGAEDLGEAPAPSDEDLTPADTPTPMPTPTPRPTPLPTPTPIPPSAAVEPTGTNLATKLAAYRTAARGKDLDTALKAQRDLLAAVDQGEAALKTDKSRQAQALVAAMGNIRSGIAGDNNAMDHAEAALRIPLSGTGPGATGLSQATPSVDIGTTIDAMNEKLRGFRQALRDHNVENAMKLQGELLSNLTFAERAAAQDNSESGKALQGALAQLHKGLDGDPDQLAAAAESLGRIRPGGGGTAQQPDADTTILAQSLMTKLDAFRTATTGGSPTDMLRLQRDVLAAADQATAALGFDESANARALRDAIAATRAGVSGDTSKLDGARASLAKLAGDQAVAAADPKQAAPGAAPITDLSHFANDMEQTIIAFQAAIQKNDTGSMLKLQRDLVDKTDQADAALKNVPSKPAETMRSATATVRTAFSGDLSKLDDALRQLRTISGSKAPAPATAAKARPTPNQPPPDPQPLANELKNALNTLRQGVQDQSQTAGQNRTAAEIASRNDDIQKRRAALLTQVNKAEAALANSTDPRAGRIRDALGGLREAAKGDDAKIDSASQQLDDALQQQP